MNRPAQTATILVRHAPPAQPQVKLPAAWMHLPVGDAANNWVQVSKTGNGKYSAEVGKETFVDKIKTSLADGRILTAPMDNPVEVLERECTDATLTDCGAPIRYEVRREIKVH